MTISVAILAGGLATRLRPLTEHFPKAMIDVNGKPFLEYQLALLKQQNLTEIVLCVGYEGKQIEDYFGNGHKYGVNLQYSYDGDTLLGTGGALKKALPLLSNTFTVIYGDSYLGIDYHPVISTLNNQDKIEPYPALALMTVYKNSSQYDQSNVLYKDNSIIKYDKRNPTPEMEHIDWGLGVINKGAFASFDSSKQFDLADLYEQLVSKKQLLGFEVFQRFYEIGSHQGLTEFKELKKEVS